MNQLLRKWSKTNGFVLLNECLITIVVFIMAVTLNGDWIIIAVHIGKQFELIESETNYKIEDTFEWLSLKDFRYFWISTMLTGFILYFIAGGFLHWFYYVRQKDNPESWKCQPYRWLSRELELDEIKAGSISLLVTNTWSAIVACYAYNKGKYSTVYYKWDEYGIIWWLLQFPLIFIYQDYLTYWMHRIFHYPYLYKRFHKTHHKYREPTAFSVTAIHPVEISCMQMVLLAPLFTVPIHWAPFYTVLLNSAYHGVTTHSGINFKAKWWQPWQPDSTFHDNHHQYYHLNFGFNCYLWDKIHKTDRQPDRIYNENIFYGTGKSISELTPEELRKEIEERQTESKSAYEQNNNPFVSSLKKINSQSTKLKDIPKMGTEFSRN